MSTCIDCYGTNSIDPCATVGCISTNYAKCITYSGPDLFCATGGVKTFNFTGVAVNPGTTTDYTVSPTGGTGSGLSVKVTRTVGSLVYKVIVVAPGTGYTINDVLTVAGATIGGATTANNLTIAVLSLVPLISSPNNLDTVIASLNARICLATPSGLDWDLWLGTAPQKDYVENLIPGSWRGWWDYGTGALGDLGCHLMEAPFRVLGLKYASDVQASVSSVFTAFGKRGVFLDSCPPSSHATLTFPKTDRTKGPVTMHWMDGGIKPERPEELGPDEMFGDGNSGILFIGTKGKMMASEYAANPRLLPLSRNQEVKVPRKLERVPGSADGHYAQWVEGAIAGYGKKQLSSPFDLAGPLTEAILMANLAIRVADMPFPRKTGNGMHYPGSNTKLLWDQQNMRVTNFDAANQFVKRQYRAGWGELTL